MAATINLFRMALAAWVLALFPVQALSADIPLRSFPLAEAVNTFSGQLPEYRLVTGRISSVGAIVRAESETIIKGQVTKITYEIPRVHSPEEVMGYYQNQLSGLNANILFSCSGRDCGRSNDWANEIFDQRILYGPDRYQYYTVASFTAGGTPYVAVIYTIRRGNQRIYAHLELVALDKPLDGASDQEQKFLLITAEEITQLRALDEKLEPWVAKVKEEFESPRIFILAYGRMPNDTAMTNLNSAADLGRTLQLYLGRRAFSQDRIQVITVGPFSSDKAFNQHDKFVKIYAVADK